MNHSIRKPSVAGPKISGPHLCAHAGKHSLDLARASLLNASEIRGGELSTHDINLVFDFLSESQEMFDFFRSHYATCGQLHRHLTFVSPTKDFFAMSVLRFFCYDVLRSAFENQIRHCAGDWEVIFLSSLTGYIGDHIDPDFELKLSKAYMAIANEHGTDATPMTVANDPCVQEIMRDCLCRLLDSHAGMTEFCDRINKALAEKFNDYGPSPIKVSEPVLAKFFERLKNPQEANYFRKQVLA